MIKLDITGVHFDIDEKLKSYVTKKIGKLDRYVPRANRESLYGKVVLTEEDGKSKNRFTAEVTLNLPHGTVNAKDSTINIFAAVDIIEAKAKSQLLKYKSKATEHYPHRRILRRIKGLSPFNKEDV